MQLSYTILCGLLREAGTLKRRRTKRLGFMRSKRNKLPAMIFRLIFCVISLLIFPWAVWAAPCTLAMTQPNSWVTLKVNAVVRAARTAFDNEEGRPAYDRVVKGIADSLRRCKLSEDEHFAARHPHFIEYIKLVSIAQLPDHELGFLVPDRQYFAETREFVQVPQFLLTQSFLRSVSRDETLDRAKLLLQELNSKRAPNDQLIFFSYRSQHLGTPDNDNSFKRLLIVVPGNAEKGVPEKWVQFGITDRGARMHIRNLSVVSAMPAPDGASNFYFKDFYRSYDRDGLIRINGRLELGFGDDNCVSCHKSGILPIFPTPGSVRASEQQALAAVNQRFLTYGAPRFQNYVDVTKFGPGLTSASIESRERRFGAGFDKSVLGRAMTCVACHHQGRLGSLNWPMDSTIIRSFVEGGQMPLGHKLTTSQRSQLYRKLIQEYFATDATNPGILKTWLMDGNELAAPFQARITHKIKGLME